MINKNKNINPASSTIKRVIKMLDIIMIIIVPNYNIIKKYVYIKYNDSINDKL